MTGRCSYCGCCLTYRADPRKESLATPDQKRAEWEAVRDSSNWPLLAERLRTYGYRQVWGIAFRCPGCSRSGGVFRPEYGRDEAEAIAAAQNERTASSTALEAAAGWRQEVRRRSEREARQLAEWLQAQLPEWAPFVQFMSGEEDGVEWDCALVARVPSANPAVVVALEVRVLGGEVRPSWGQFWHTHFERQFDAEGEDLEHVHRAVDMLANLAAERLLVVATYRDGAAQSAGCVPRETEFPEWVRRASETSERVVIHSWRGTYDRELHAKSLLA